MVLRMNSQWLYFLVKHGGNKQMNVCGTSEWTFVEQVEHWWTSGWMSGRRANKVLAVTWAECQATIPCSEGMNLDEWQQAQRPPMHVHSVHDIKDWLVTLGSLISLPVLYIRKQYVSRFCLFCVECVSKCRICLKKTLWGRNVAKYDELLCTPRLPRWFAHEHLRITHPHNLWPKRLVVQGLGGYNPMFCTWCTYDSSIAFRS